MPDSDVPPPTTGQQLYDAGWYQGTILPVEVVVRIRPATVPENYQYAVLITQDCNIVAEDEKESHVEVTFGYCPQATDNTNALAQGKNPRLFLIEVPQGQRFVWDVRQRVSVSKTALHTALGSSEPVGRLLDSDLREFRIWLSRRYTRPAFPGNFNERLRPAKSATDKVIKTDAFRSIRAVFYLITERDEELPEGMPYHLRIIFCFKHNGTADPLPQAATEIEKFTKAVANCPGIELTKHESIPDTRFPIQYLDVWECVDFDARSYGSSESAPPRI